MADYQSITHRAAWQALSAHYQQIKNVNFKTLFAQDAQRGERFTAEAAGLYLDYSKHRITAETLRLLLNLAEESGLRERIDAMFRGDKINLTENRAVLHVALRAPRDAQIFVDGKDVVPEVHAVLDKMSDFCQPRAQRRMERATRANAFATSSTSASADRTSARSWPTKRCATTRRAT